MMAPAGARRAVPARPRRDRHGRGLRGVLLPAGLPGARTRAEAFDELVLDVVDDLSQRWGTELADVDVVVEDVPALEAEAVTLSRAEPATDEAPARIVVHRRPVESRARSALVREALVLDAVVEAFADLMGLAPEDVDPDRADRDPPA